MEHTSGTLSTWPWSTLDPIFHSAWTKPREIGKLLLGDIIIAVNGARVSARARGISRMASDFFGKKTLPRLYFVK